MLSRRYIPFYFFYNLYTFKTFRIYVYTLVLRTYTKHYKSLLNILQYSVPKSINYIFNNINFNMNTFKYSPVSTFITQDNSLSLNKGINNTQTHSNKIRTISMYMKNIQQSYGRFKNYRRLKFNRLYNIINSKKLNNDSLSYFKKINVHYFFKFFSKKFFNNYLSIFYRYLSSIKKERNYLKNVSLSKSVNMGTIIYKERYKNMFFTFLDNSNNVLTSRSSAVGGFNKSNNN